MAGTASASPFYEPITARDAWLKRRGIRIPLRNPLAWPRLAGIEDKVTAGRSPADPAASVGIATLR